MCRPGGWYCGVVGLAILLAAAPMARTDPRVQPGGLEKPRLTIAAGPAEARPPGRRRALFDQMVATLNKPVSLEFEPNTSLKDCMGHIGERYGLTILVNSDAFKQDLQLDAVEERPVRLPRVSGVRLATVLEKLVDQVQGTFLVRSDHIEITTRQRMQAEVWGNVQPEEIQPIQSCVWPLTTGLCFNSIIPMSFALPAAPDRLSTRTRPMMRLVYASFINQPLNEALEDLADLTGISVVLDGKRVAEKAKTNVTVRLANVPLDTAVRLLASQAELQMVMLDNVLFVTTPENARIMRTEQEKVNQKGLTPPAGIRDAAAP